MNSNRNHQQFKVRSGVFSRKYIIPSGQVYGVAYHTPSQSVAIFEGDSAHVWHNIWESNGDTTQALDYILQNGVYDNDPYNDACITLNSFIENLIDSNLLLPEDEYDHHISRDQYKRLTFPKLFAQKNIKIYSEISTRKFEALCRNARLVIANDCGPMHIAAPSGANLIAIFGPTNPHCWFAYSGAHRKYVQKGTGANKLGILTETVTWDEGATVNDVWLVIKKMFEESKDAVNGRASAASG